MISWTTSKDYGTRPRPARPRRHLAPVAASALGRDLAAPGLACGATPWSQHRQRDLPEGTGLAGILRPASVPQSRPARPSRWTSASRNSNGGRSDKDFRAWTRGQTGIPIVDAGMRQLWQTGWMHNRVRMIVASLLIKHLGIHWREGERWFWDTLVDADLANNSRQLAMGGRLRRRCRALLPHLQSGAAGREIRSRRRLCPPLCAGTEATCRTDIIHRPWEAPQPPADYPAPDCGFGGRAATAPSRLSKP